jgi:hypothetical protein
MYQHQPRQTWSSRILGSARTLAAIIITALLASALTVRWSDASATSVTTFVPLHSATMAGIPVTIHGTVVGASDGMVAIVEDGAESPVAFPVSDSASVLRGGEAVALDALRVGDTVNLTVDGLSGQVQRLHASPAGDAAFIPYVSGTAAFLAALGLIAGATALAIRNLDRLPALSFRLPATRLLHAQGAR